MTKPQSIIGEANDSPFLSSLQKRKKGDSTKQQMNDSISSPTGTSQQITRPCVSRDYDTTKIYGINITPPTLSSPAHHAKLTYLDIQSFGPPCNPLKFPSPEIFRGQRLNLRCKKADGDKYSNTYKCAKRSIIRIHTSKEPNNYGSQYTSNIAYHKIPNKKVIKTGMGWIEICRVLKRNNYYKKKEKTSPSSKRNMSNNFDSNASSADIYRPVYPLDYTSFSSSSSSSSSESEQENLKTGSRKRKSFFFIETDQVVAIKVYHLDKININRSRGSENALYEIAAMQMLGIDHPNVLGCYEVLCDSTYIYMVMPYCDNGELYQRLQTYRKNDGRDGSKKYHINYADDSSVISKKSYQEPGLSEAEARYWFRQILNGMHYLQEHGICHRDLSLENIMLTEDGYCKIIDFGYCIKVPYSKRVYTQSDGRMEVVKDRRLITPRKPCGRLNCMAPEFYRSSKEGMDGFAIDLWSVGVILYELLTGQFAYDRPSRDDDLFCLLTQNLEYLLDLCHVNLTVEAVDLLKGIFVEDPRRRFTLSDMMTHPWVTMIKPEHTVRTFNLHDDEESQSDESMSDEDLTFEGINLLV